jgi:hypothetical protein
MNVTMIRTQSTANQQRTMHAGDTDVVLSCLAVASHMVQVHLFNMSVVRVVVLLALVAAAAAQPCIECKVRAAEAGRPGH